MLACSGLRQAFAWPLYWVHAAVLPGHCIGLMRQFCPAIGATPVWDRMYFLYRRRQSAGPSTHRCSKWERIMVTTAVSLWWWQGRWSCTCVQLLLQLLYRLVTPIVFAGVVRVCRVATIRLSGQLQIRLSKHLRETTAVIASCDRRPMALL